MLVISSYRCHIFVKFGLILLESADRFPLTAITGLFVAGLAAAVGQIFPHSSDEALVREFVKEEVLIQSDEHIPHRHLVIQRHPYLLQFQVDFAGINHKRTLFSLMEVISH